MKTLYIECGMGAAGDMLAGALLGIAPEGSLEKLRSLGIHGVSIDAEEGEKCGIRARRLRVLVNGTEEGEEHRHDHTHLHEHEHDHTHDHEHEHGHAHGHHHSSMAEIREIIDGLDIPEAVKMDAFAVYTIIADAESKVHGVPVTDIHFHEVGSLDAVADVVSCCLLMDEIAPDRVVVSPVNVGSGSVECAHGILPVPAPATAEILSGIPYYGDDTGSELCTPTGAALLAYFADEFGDRPLMTDTVCGTGMGKKDFTRANVIRVFEGESPEEGPAYGSGSVDNSTPDGSISDTAAVLSANIDDMTGEELGFAMQALFKEGALDVWYVPAFMKKNRPAYTLHCLCRDVDADRLAEAVFRYTTTAGIRRIDAGRYVLDRKTDEKNGVRIKSYSGYGVERTKAEYDDIAGIAGTRGVSLRDAAEDVKNM
jgi:uncharacterized protein (TIGR00299 family) protein